MENNIKHIDEAIYELGPDKVIKKRKSVLPALIVLVVGAVMVAASFMPEVKASENLYTALVFMGWTVVAAGVVWALIVLLGGTGRPYYVPTGEFLKRTEMYYDPQHLGKVREHVSKGDFKKLAAIEGGMGTVVMVVLYQGKKTGSTICQVLTYIPHNYEPADPMLVFEKSGSEFVLV